MSFLQNRSAKVIGVGLLSALSLGGCSRPDGEPQAEGEPKSISEMAKKYPDDFRAAEFELYKRESPNAPLPVRMSADEHVLDLIREEVPKGEKIETSETYRVLVEKNARFFKESLQGDDVHRVYYTLDAIDDYFGRRAKDLLPLVIAKLDDPDPKIVFKALKAIDSIGVYADDSMTNTVRDRATETLDHAHGAVRRAALELLHGKFCLVAANAKPKPDLPRATVDKALYLAKTDPFRDVREAAITVLGHATGKRPELVDAMMDVFGAHKNYGVHWQILREVAKHGVSRPKDVGLLINYIRSENTSGFLECAVEATGRSGDFGVAAASDLVKLLGAPERCDSELAMEVGKALGRLGIAKEHEYDLVGTQRQHKASDPRALYASLALITSGLELSERTRSLAVRSMEVAVKNRKFDLMLAMTYHLDDFSMRNGVPVPLELNPSLWENMLTSGTTKTVDISTARENIARRANERPNYCDQALDTYCEFLQGPYPHPEIETYSQYHYEGEIKDTIDAIGKLPPAAFVGAEVESKLIRTLSRFILAEKFGYGTRRAALSVLQERLPNIEETLPAAKRMASDVALMEERCESTKFSGWVHAAAVFNYERDFDRRRNKI